MSSAYGSVEAAGEASVRLKDEEKGSVETKNSVQTTGSRAGLKAPHYNFIFVVSLAIIGVVLFLVLADVWGMGFRRGDDDDDDGGDGDDGEPECKINDPRTSNSRYTTTLTKVELNLTKYPNAVCNDGSPGAYYFEAADPDGPHRATWVFMLQGGSWCFDEESCQQRKDGTEEILRAGELVDPQETGSVATSSTIWQNTTSISGVFVAHPCSRLYGVNKVWLAYCSADAYMSSSSASPETLDMHFQGATILDAVLNEAMTTHGLLDQADSWDSDSDGDLEKPLVVLTGYSAGSRGVMVHLDRIRDEIHDQSPNIDVYGVLDSVVWLENLQGQVSDLVNQTKKAIDFLNITADRIDTDCFLDHANELWKCIFSQYRLFYLDTPYMVISSTRDLRLRSQGSFPKTGEKDLLKNPESPFEKVGKVDEDQGGTQKEFFAEVASQVLELFIELQEANSIVTAYAPSCDTHTYIHKDTFLDFVVNSDNSTTMLFALEQALDKVGFVRSRAEGCPEMCTFPPYNGEAEGTVPREYSLKDGFFLDNCELGISCGPCEDTLHDDLRTLADE
mmetsp:Transcript_10204/g.21275  ORF Transcript_10204/g.21275 Transcript_10204/m.21275 type:complete len:562 (-) Transcript_10204:238-1923(-)|eukprot:CAMPEP_0118923322 /NCGR_PEP_ID=MMETSP1169-20130426/1887_1 /TAXON_ID=36882 /ORGANISM="Pyramimonas obovata, Strain CCMP722" /LENGTH=561 /DNA_ID=CAMNT_0006864291 /DNA_START=454 /DNA_END=2139 /DNA_ORIENTATION=+